ncbi:thioredoxin family protein [Pararhodobacter oceanensis]|uniref:thioredoxin family protein n=1 Tax=Pararhodobacter oceanensis TaxID=2172121 RepID=UPI003A8F8C40
MHRRQFLSLTTASLMLPFAARAAFIDYAPGVAEDAMARGERIILDFYATWCSTCARQQRVMDALRVENAEYDRDLTLIHVDWDQYGGGALAQRFAVPRRSTIIALKGEVELGRTVAGTSRADIQALFDLALNAE